jgi:hypothetical protein
MHYTALLSSALIVATQGQSKQCSCGAVADPLIGLCRKCQSRKAWRRKTTQPRRKSNRRRFIRHVHDDSARFLAGLCTMLPALTNELEA